MVGATARDFVPAGALSSFMHSAANMALRFYQSHKDTSGLANMTTWVTGNHVQHCNKVRAHQHGHLGTQRQCVTYLSS